MRENNFGKVEIKVEISIKVEMMRIKSKINFVIKVKMSKNGNVKKSNYMVCQLYI